MIYKNYYFLSVIYIYVLFLVRSERKKLQEENLEMQFINNEAEEAHRGEPV